MSTWENRFGTGTKLYPGNCGRQQVSLTAITAPLIFTSGLADCVVIKPDKGFQGGCYVSRTSAELRTGEVKATFDTNIPYFVGRLMEKLMDVGIIRDLGYGCSDLDLGIGVFVDLVRAKGNPAIRTATDS